MKLSTIINPNEKRVAITPEVTAKYVKLGFEVELPKGVGESAGFSDSEYEAAGATISDDKINDVTLYLCVRPVLSENMELSKGSYLIAMLSPFQNEEVLKKLYLKKYY